MDKNQLINLIYDSYHNVSPPDNKDSIINRRGQDFAPLRVNDWRTISFSTIRDCRDALMFDPTPQWLLFLLPAFLTKILENWEEGDTLIDEIALCLTPPAFRKRFTLESEENFLKFVSLLSKDQCYVFDQYLRYVVKNYLDDIIYDSSDTDRSILWAIKYWNYKSSAKS